MEQHPVPQNITTFQFRLVGDMTVKQFAYLAAGTLGAYMAYKLPLPIVFTIPLAVAVFLLGFGLAFVPVEERPMDIWVAAFIKSIYAPTLFVWMREKPRPVKNTAPPTPVISKPTVAAVIPAPVTNTKTTTSSLVPPSANANTGVGNIPTTNPTPTAHQPANTHQPAVTAPTITPVAHRTPEVTTEKAVPRAPQSGAEIKKTIPAKQNPFGKFNQIIKSFFYSPARPKSVPTKTQTAPPVKTSQPHTAPHITSAAVITQKPQTGDGFFSQLIKFFMPEVKPKPAATTHPHQTITSPAPPPPVPNVVKPAFDQVPTVIHSAHQKTDIKDIFAGIKTPSVVGKTLNVQPTASTPTPPPPDQEETDRRIKEAQSASNNQINQLQQQLNSMQSEMKQKTDTESRLIELQKQLTQALNDRNKLEDQLMEMHEQIKKMERPNAPPPSTIAKPKTFTQEPGVRVISAENAVKSGLPKLTTFPNVVTGIIKDEDAVLLPGVLVTIRDKDDVPLRALKTNRLGQFAASTPLPDGTYIVEVEDPRNRFIFDRVQITLRGTIAPAIEIIAKSQKQISREKLAKEIFGQPANFTGAQKDTGKT